MTENGLTDKQRIFIAEYCNNGFNGTQAAIKAGYSEDNAGVIASENLKKLYIRDAVREHLNEVLSQYKDTLEYEIIKKYKTRAFYNISDILTDRGGLVKPLADLGDLAFCIDGIETTVNSIGVEKTKYKLANPDVALERLAEYMKIIKGSEINVYNVSEKVDYSGLSEVEIERIYREKLEKIKNGK